jgi:hypothetical protein
MRHSLLILSLLLASFSATAENYFTLVDAVNDTLRIDPSWIDTGRSFLVGAHLEGRIDHWSITMSSPNPAKFSISISCDSSNHDMFIPYITQNGSSSICQAPFNIYANSSDTLIVSTITEYGYWDYEHDGIYEPYGTVKWEAGDHTNMFKLSCWIHADCTGDSIVFNSEVDCTYDWRGGMTSGDGHKRIILKMAYKRGDVNGDGLLNTTDVTTLINYVLSHDGLDQYQLEAADVNGDGNVSMQDVSALINLLLANGQNVNPNDFDFGTES